MENKYHLVTLTVRIKRHNEYRMGVVVEVSIATLDNCFGTHQVSKLTLEYIYYRLVGKYKYIRQVSES